MGAEIAAGGTGALDLILKAFGGEHNPKLRRASQGAAMGAVAWRLAKQFHGRKVARNTFSVAIAEDDDVYPELHAWVLDQMPSDSRRALTVKTRRAGTRMDSDGDRPTPVALKLHYDGSRAALVHVGQHPVQVQIESPTGGSPTEVGEEEMVRIFARRSRLIFTASTAEGRDAVLDTIRGLANASHKQMPRLHIANRWGDWQQRSDLPLRTLDTVVLRAGQGEGLTDDLTRFLGAETTYGRLGLPWHRGYVFHGPPGTGKTSLARALATHFALDVYFASLSDLKNDSHLLGLVGSVPARSMLLLEDVDVLHAATSREDDEGHAGLSALLNALDGIATPHGLITVMTTNNLDALDPALIRAGRVDRIEHIDYLDHDQAERLAELVCGHPVGLPPIADRLTPAVMLEGAKPYLERPDLLPAALVEATRPPRLELVQAR